MAERAMQWWPAPAKINRFLHVLGRRPDGYHEIQTLFQLLDWGDEIGFRRLGHPGIIRQAVSYGVPEADDLVTRAARLLQSRTGKRLGAEIAVRKRVPPGSGMGGGSSDAATVLLVLNRIWDCGLSIPELSSLAAGLGADVPVFVEGRSAMATGIGEKLQACALGEQHYVLVFPELAVATQEIFADPELNRNSRPITAAAALQGRGHNDCEVVVRKRYPALDRLMRDIAQWGRPLMTGTGSGIFIAMPDRKTAINTARAMKTLYNVRAVQGVDRSPLHVKLDG